MEKRAIIAEIRADEGEEPKVSGLGIVYDEWTEIWPGYKEKISQGAVQRAETVKSFFNHDPDKVLSTLDSNPALALNDTDRGLEYVSPIPPTSYGNDLKINLERGNVKGSSFAFDVPEDGEKLTRDKGVIYRDITKLTLYEVGPVTDPAYIQTTANMRSKDELERKLKEQEPKTIPLSLRKKQQAQKEKDLSSGGF